MRRSTSRWIVGVSIAGIVHIGIYWMVGWLSDSNEGVRMRYAKGANLQFIGSDAEELSSVMREQIMLFDPKPLMMPTRWNGANYEPIDIYATMDSELFPDYAPMFASEGGDFVGPFGNSWNRAGSPRANQLAFPFVVTRQFGRKAFNRARSDREGIGLEVVELSSGRFVFSRDILNNAARSVLEEEEAWESVEFLVQVVDSFHVGAPSTVQSSRFPEIDRMLSELMTKELLPKGLLVNGSYLIRVSR